MPVWGRGGMSRKEKGDKDGKDLRKAVMTKPRNELLVTCYCLLTNEELHNSLL